MRISSWKLIPVLAFFVVGLFAVETAAAAPSITSLSRTSGNIGASITITGTNFGSPQGASTVTFNGTLATVTTWSNTSIAVIVPSGATTGNVVVTVAGVASNGISFTVLYLPTGWTDVDVGSVGAAGSASYSGGVFTVAGSGSNGLIFGSADAFNFAYQTLSGDGTIVARVLTTPYFADAGIMIRDTLTAGAINASAVYTGPNVPSAGSYFYFTYRSSVGANASYQNDPGGRVLPYWIKLVRSGSSFTSYESLDGVNWTQFGTSQVLNVGQNAYIGLGVTSGQSSLATATFDNVSISTTSAPAPVITSVSGTSGSVGSQFTISGTGFGASQGSSLALLNGAQVTVNSWSSTSITITIPSGATSGPLAIAVAPSMNSSNAIQFTVTSNPLPTGWFDQDVGPVVTIGSASFSNNIFTINGGSLGIAMGSVTTADGFHFVYQPLSGDGTIVARVVSLQAGGTSEVCLMIRETLDSGSTNECLQFRGSAPQQAIWSYRPSPGASSSYGSSLSGLQVPYWLRLAREGNFVSAYTSPDGVNWSQLGFPQVLAMQQNLYIGLGMSNGSTGPLATATFDNVSVSSTSASAPVIKSVSATTGTIGSQVVISGTGFGASQGGSVVYLNGAPVTINSWSASSITITIPSGATSGPLAVAVAPSMNSSNSVFFTVTAQALLSGWLDQDVGNVGKAGSASYASGVFTVQGAGTIGSVADGLHFVYQPLTTNGTIVARVTGISSAVNFAQVGVMIRETLAGNSADIFPYVQYYSTPSYTNYMYYRIGANALASQVGGTAVTLPYWLKAVRITNTFSAYTSTDGSNWTQIGATQTITTAQTVYVGLGVSSGATTGLATATFDNVTVTPGGTLPNPVVSGITPTAGVVGSTVTINGSGFGATQGTSTVLFNNATATVTSWSDTQILALVPGGASLGPVSVQAGNITTVGAVFTPSIKAQLTDSLGNQSNYTSQVTGGKWNVLNYQGSGCSTCTSRGNIQKQYDGSGNEIFSTDALGNTATYSYDSSNNLLSQTAPINGSTTATTSYTYNSRGQVLTATDPRGYVTTNTYDAKGNLLTVTTPPPDGSTAGSLTTFAYNSLGQLTTITDPLSHATQLTYTTAGLIATITDAQSNVTTYGYDAHGNRTSVTDALNHQTTFAYDAGDRLTKITYPDTTTTTFGYDYRGRRTSVTDQNGKTTTYAYDDADRLTSVTDAATPGNVTTYGYDTESNLTSITDANLHTTSFAYDAYGRVSKTTFPSTNIETYGYDANNNLTSKTDRKNQTITYTYDQLNRLTGKTYPDSTTVNYTYDKASRLTQVSDPTGTYQFTFDNMGRLISTTTNYTFLTGRSFATSYAYDKASNRTGFTDPESGATAYVYDTLNRLQTLTPPSAFSSSGNFGFSYDALSRRTQMTRPNSLATNYTYDNLSRLISVLHQSGSTTLDGATYGVDNAGNRSSRTPQPSGTATNFGYDNIYELLSATQGSTSTESYTYDPVGNRLSSLGVSPYTNNTSNELTSTPSTTYTYDYNGNTATEVTSSGTTTFAWDFENRLSSVTLPGTGGTVSFKYDPFGRRIYKSSSSGTSIFAYDGDNLVEETNSSGGVVARYSQNLSIDEPLAMLRTSTTSYYHADGLGSVTSLSNAAGSLAQTYAFDSFGKPTSSTGSLTNPFRYTAREFDAETNLYYYRARYYDPSTGHFLSEDPIAFAGGINFYRYVRNSPPNFVDERGTNANPLPIEDLQPGLGPVAAYCAANPIVCVGIFDAGLAIYDAYGVYQLGVASGLWNPVKPFKDPATETANTIGNANVKAKKQCDKRNKNCPDCNPPAGTIAYEVDTSHFHFPFVSGRHWHLLVMSQNPNTCQCFWQRIGAGNGQPPSNAQPFDPKNPW